MPVTTNLITLTSQVCTINLWVTNRDSYHPPLIRLLEKLYPFRNLK